MKQSSLNDFHVESRAETWTAVGLPIVAQDEHRRKLGRVMHLEVQGKCTRSVPVTKCLHLDVPKTQSVPAFIHDWKKSKNRMLVVDI